jgi:Helicase conserved C-terminal domain
VVLKQDMVRRFQDANIQYAIWSGHGSSERFNGVPVLFVSAEQAVKQPFRRWIGMLDANRQLDRVVFDEAHLVLTSSSYRPKMAMIRFLRELRCQVVFLSATLPPVMMPEFSQRMMLDQARVIRDVTFRSDIRYVVQQQAPMTEEERADSELSGEDSFHAWVVSTVQQVLTRFEEQETRARCIVYVESRDMAEKLAELLGCEFYHSQSGTGIEKDQVLQRWRRGEYPVIVATSAFGMGVDYAHVRNVFHYGLPSDAINFSQEVGRIGRDGHSGVSTILLSRQVQDTDDGRWEREKHKTPLSQRVMQRYIKSRCLRAVLSRYVDGPEYMQYCNDVRIRCTYCRIRGATDESDGLFDPDIELDPTPWWDAEPRSVPEEGDMDEDDLSEPTGFGATTFEGGPQRLHDAERNSAYRLTQYIRRLKQWKGHCLICRLLHDADACNHPLDQCRRQSKFQFFRAKGPFAKRGQSREWMTDWTACWGCGQPPIICSDWDPQIGPGGCEFRDLALPAAWAVFHMRNRWGETLEAFSGEPGGFATEEDWMRWIGQEVALFGDRGIQAARILDQVLEKLEHGG